ncbi:hypothetical protein OKW30_004691 [Paraburkholderia sp. Clong3]|uniref:hypothetical protein n=1 Tax=Paraburkholderia sp. Clong3 TaxID=2991061 RepID=UPI003D1CCA93
MQSLCHFLAFQYWFSTKHKFLLKLEVEKNNMSPDGVKNSIFELVTDSNNAVVAMSGKWGTGKTWLWRSIKKDVEDKIGRPTLYVSLFGIRSADEMKLRLLADAALHGDESKLKRETIKTLSTGMRVLRRLHPGAALLNDLALLSMDAVLKDRFVVIDDIERAQSSFALDELLGFINQFAEHINTRFLLILNIGELKDVERWDALREKVIQHEISLEPSAINAFDIALREVPCRYAEELRAVVSRINVTNIRVLHRLLRTVNSTVGRYPNLSTEIASRMVPSTALLAAIHYKALADGPSKEFVLSFNSFIAAFHRIEGQNNEQTGWESLLGDLGIMVSDEYEVLVARYLDTGLLDREGLDAIVSKYQSETDVQTLHSEFQSLIGDYWGDPAASC